VGRFHRGLEVPMRATGRWLPFGGDVLPLSYKDQVGVIVLMGPSHTHHTSLLCVDRPKFSSEIVPLLLE
jgi:hypothetical protein